MPQVTDLIPHRPPFLFVDEIVSESPDGLVAKRTWRAEEDFYKGHYPGAPITPGVLLCEAVFQTAACFMALKARTAGTMAGDGAKAVPLIAKISDVRFRSPIYPGDTITLEVKEKDALGGFTMLSGAIKKLDGTRILSGDFAVAWKTPATWRGSRSEQRGRPHPQRGSEGESIPAPESTRYPLPAARYFPAMP